MAVLCKLSIINYSLHIVARSGLSSKEGADYTQRDYCLNASRHLGLCTLNKQNGRWRALQKRMQPYAAVESNTLVFPGRLRSSIYLRRIPADFPISPVNNAVCSPRPRYGRTDGYVYPVVCDGRRLLYYYVERLTTGTRIWNRLTSVCILCSTYRISSPAAYYSEVRLPCAVYTVHMTI